MSLLAITDLPFRFDDNLHRWKRQGGMVQVAQAIAALAIKMGQGKKGGKPMKVSTHRAPSL